MEFSFAAKFYCKLQPRAMLSQAIKLASRRENISFLQGDWMVRTFGIIIKRVCQYLWRSALMASCIILFRLWWFTPEMWFLIDVIERYWKDILKTIAKCIKCFELLRYRIFSWINVVIQVTDTLLQLQYFFVICLKENDV